MKRFILSGAPDSGARVRLSGDDYHYLVRVRRLAPGEWFPALLPGGEEVLVQVRSVENGVLLGEITRRADSGAPARMSAPGAREPRLILLQALPKGEKMDLIVRQAAEGAVAEIVPFVSEFSLPRRKDGGGEKKLARWERIIKEARQQSGSQVETAIRGPLDMDGLFAFWAGLEAEHPGALGLLFHHLPLAQTSLQGILIVIPG